MHTNNYTNTGAISSLKLTKNWMLQLGLTMGTGHGRVECANGLADQSADRPSRLYRPQGSRSAPQRDRLRAMAKRYADDAVYLCANSIKQWTWGYNNLQWYGGTFYHKFNDDGIFQPNPIMPSKETRRMCRKVTRTRPFHDFFQRTGPMRPIARAA